MASVHLAGVSCNRWRSNALMTRFMCILAFSVVLCAVFPMTQAQSPNTTAPEPKPISTPAINGPLEPTVYAPSCSQVIQTTLFAYSAVIILIFACVVCLFPFIIMAFQNLDKIANGYPTISSFSSDPHANPTASRFIIVMTCAIGGALTSLLIQEYNSRCDHDPRFYVEVSSCFLLPLVGIFFTTGNPDSKFANKYYTTLNCGVFTAKIKIAISDFLHSISALYFMVSNGVINVMYAMALRQRDIDLNRPHSGPTIIALGMSWATVAILYLFILTMATLTFIPKYKKQGKQYCRGTCTGEDWGLFFDWCYDLVVDGIKSFFKGLKGLFHSFCPPCECPDVDATPDETCHQCHAAGDIKTICPECGCNLSPDPLPPARASRRFLCVCAFFLEFCALIMVVFTTAFCSIKRNNAVPWWK